MRQFAVVSVLFCIVPSVLTITLVYQPCVLFSRLHQYVQEGTVVDCECEDWNQTLEERVWQSAKFGILARNNDSVKNLEHLNLTPTDIYDGDVIQCKSQTGTTTDIAGDFHILVAYAAEVNNATINDHAGSVQISNKSLVHFECQSDANSQPHVVIAPVSGDRFLQAGLSPLNFTTRLSCDHATAYLCRANSSVGILGISVVNITVSCVNDPPHQDLVPIIVGSVVPAASIIIAIIVIVGIIRCKRSRPNEPEPDVLTSTERAHHDYTNTGPGGSHLSGSYSDLTRASQVTMNPYETYCTATALGEEASVSPEVDSPVYIPPKDHILGIAEENQSDNIFKEPSIEIIPIVPGATRTRNIEGSSIEIIPIVPGATSTQNIEKPSIEIIPIVPGATSTRNIEGSGIEIIPIVPGATSTRNIEGSSIEMIPIVPGATSTRNIEGSSIEIIPIVPGATSTRNIEGSSIEIIPLVPGATSTRNIEGSSIEMIPIVQGATSTRNIEGSSVEIIPIVPGATNTRNIEGSSIEIIPIVPGATSTRNIQGSGIEIIPIVPGATSTRNIEGSSIEIIPIVPGATSTRNIEGSSIEIIPIVPAVTNTQKVDEAHLVNLRHKPPLIPKKTRPKLEPADSLSRDTWLYKVPPTNTRWAS